MELPHPLVFGNCSSQWLTHEHRGSSLQTSGMHSSSQRLTQHSNTSDCLDTLLFRNSLLDKGHGYYRVTSAFIWCLRQTPAGLDVLHRSVSQHFDSIILVLVGFTTKKWSLQPPHHTRWSHHTVHSPACILGNPLLFLTMILKRLSSPL